MAALLSFIATLAVLGVALSAIHWLLAWLRLPDIAALLLFAVPLIAYLSYATQDSCGQRIRAALRMYLVFAGVVLSAAALVYLIG